MQLLRAHIKRYGTAPDGRIFQTARGGILQDSGYNEVWAEARKEALTPAQQRSPLGRRPYDLRHAAVSLWLNSGVPATEVARRAGHGVAVLLKIYAHCIDGQADAANQRITDALGIRDARARAQVTKKTTTPSRPPEMPGQRRKAGRTVGVTASTAPVRGFFRPRPWTELGTHGRIADGRGPRRLGRRMCWSAAWVSVGGTVCKTVGSAYVGSNPTPATLFSQVKAGATGWRHRLLRPLRAVRGPFVKVFGPAVGRIGRRAAVRILF